MLSTSSLRSRKLLKIALVVFRFSHLNHNTKHGCETIPGYLVVLALCFVVLMYVELHCNADEKKLTLKNNDVSTGSTPTATCGGTQAINNWLPRKGRSRGDPDSIGNNFEILKKCQSKLDWLDF